MYFIIKNQNQNNIRMIIVIIYLQDIGVSKDLNEQFRRHLINSAEPLDIDFSIQVLSSGSWPFQQSFTFSLPTEVKTYKKIESDLNLFFWDLGQLLTHIFYLQLERSVHRFTTFYSSQHSGRKLNWLYNMSKGELHTNCFKNRYTLQASTFQMAVLLAYNGSTSWTIQQLQYATQIKMDFLLQVI